MAMAELREDEGICLFSREILAILQEMISLGGHDLKCL